MKDRATERITLRCTPNQKEAIEKAAKGMGLSISEYLLMAALTDFTDIKAIKLISEAQEAIEKLSALKLEMKEYISEKQTNKKSSG